MARITKPPQERRQELIDTARTLFIQQGYERTTVADIVKEIGVAQGLFYYYFKSKEEIRCAVEEQHAQKIIEEMAALLSQPSQPPLSRLYAAMVTLEGFFEMIDQVSEQAQISLSPQLNARIYRLVMEKLEPYLTALLAEAQAHGVIDVPNPGIFARFLLSGLMGIYVGTSGELAGAAVLPFMRLLFERTLQLPPGAILG